MVKYRAGLTHQCARDINVFGGNLYSRRERDVKALQTREHRVAHRQPKLARVKHGHVEEVEVHVCGLGMLNDKREGPRVKPRPAQDELLNGAAQREEEEVNELSAGAFEPVPCPVFDLHRIVHSMVAHGCLGCRSGLVRLMRSGGDGECFEVGEGAHVTLSERKLVVLEAEVGQEWVLSTVQGVGWPSVVPAGGEREEREPRLAEEADGIASPCVYFVFFSRLFYMRVFHQESRALEFQWQ